MKKIVLIILLLLLFKSSQAQLCYNNIKEKEKTPVIFVDYKKNEFSYTQEHVSKLVSYLDSHIVYKFGGNKRFYLDCSSFVKRAFKELFDVNLPRTSKEMYRLGMKTDSLQLFDLVFFGSRNYVQHVGIYIGNNKFIHNSTRRGVILSVLNEEYYRKKFIMSKNIIYIIKINKMYGYTGIFK